MSRIELKNINKYYGDNHVLKDLNLTIEDGDFMTLLGPSGCGKTTTLRVVSGLERPQGGTMTIDGKEVINAVPPFSTFLSQHDFDEVQIFSAARFHRFPVADGIFVFLRQPIRPNLVIALHFPHRKHLRAKNASAPVS